MALLSQFHHPIILFKKYLMSMDVNDKLVTMSHILPWTGKQGKKFSYKILLSHHSNILDEILCSAENMKNAYQYF
jgi:hypothetical protein